MKRYYRLGLTHKLMADIRTLSFVENAYTVRCHTQNNKGMGRGKTSYHKQIMEVTFPDNEECKCLGFYD
jgi:hypothetical protein